MNYEKIYNNLIQNRRINKIDRLNNNVEYHHIIPISCGGINDIRSSKYNNKKYNIVGLTIREHFFAHLLLVQIYKNKYGITSEKYKKMLSAIILMSTTAKYKIKSSKIYESIKLQAIKNGIFKTTTGRIWITNGKKDIFLKQNQQIPDGFWKGRTICFTEEQRLKYSEKIKNGTKNRIPWNKGKKGIYTKEYRQKISDNHADCSGKNNGRYGSKVMFNIDLQIKKIVSKNNIQQLLSNGWVLFRDVSLFNNGIIEVYNTHKPDGFIYGKLVTQPISKTRVWMCHPYTDKKIHIKTQLIEDYKNNGYILGYGGKYLRK